MNPNVLEFFKRQGWQSLNEYTVFRLKDTRQLVDFSRIKRVLVILFCGIGDMIVFLPALELLSGVLRDSRISVLTHPSPSKVLENHPSVDQILLPENINSIDFGSFDLVINLSGHDERLNNILLSSNIKHLIIRSIAFDKKEIAHFWQVNVEAMMEIINSIRFKFVYLDDEERRIAGEWLASRGLDPKRDLIIAVHPGSGNPEKNWPPERFIDLCNILVENYKAKILLLSGPMDREAVEKVLGGVKVAPIVVQEPLRLVAGILERVDLLITNDSGIMHLADGVGTPTVSIFGASQPEIWGPMGYNHVIIYKERGLERITVDDVMRGVKLLLANLAQMGVRDHEVILPSDHPAMGRLG